MTSNRAATSDSSLGIRRVVKPAARLLLAALPLWWLIHKVDVAAAARAVALLGPLVFLVPIAPFLALATAAVRWRVLLFAYGARTVPAFLTLLRHCLVGYYYNVLPGAVAGDALRAFRTRDVLGGAVDSAAVVVSERIAGLVGLLILGSVALLDPTSRRLLPIAPAFGVATLLTAVLAVALFVSPTVYRRRVAAPAATSPWARVDALIRRIPVPRSASGLVASVALSLVTPGIVIVQHLLLLGILSPSAPSAVLLVVLPALILLTYVPITPGAVGQRELVYVHLLGVAGVSPEAAIALSFVVFASSLAVAALGGGVHLVEMYRKAPLEPSIRAASGEDPSAS